MYPTAITRETCIIIKRKRRLKQFSQFFSRSDAQRAAKQKEAKERELEAHAFSADRIEEGGFPVSMVSDLRTLFPFRSSNNDAK